MVDAPRTYPRELLPFVTVLPARDASWLQQVRYATPTFPAWPVGRPCPSDTKGGKPLVEIGGQPAFGELAILRAFERDGWEGRWVDNFPLPPTFRIAYWDEAWQKLPRDRANQPLPDRPRATYAAICAKAGAPTGGGAWDLILWRGTEMVFVEAKRRNSSDRIKEGQLRWLDAALRLGVPTASLVFVEWSMI